MPMKYCCGCFDHRKGVMALAILFGLSSFTGVILGSIPINDDDPNMGGVGQSMCIGAIVAGVVKTITNILLFVGCLKHKRHFFIPWMIFEMISIVIAFLIVLILLGSGIMALVVSKDVAGNLYIDREGEIYNGNKYALIGNLAGTTAIVASVVLAAVTMLFTYFWAVVQHLYKKMECQNDHTLLIEEPETEYVRQTGFVKQ